MAIGAILIVFLFTWGLASYLWRIQYRRWKYPPGPTPLPILGNMNPFVVKHRDAVKSYRALRSIYGDIFTTSLGCKDVVHVNGYDVIRECLIENGHVFHERKVGFLGIAELQGNGGLVWLPSPDWKDHRRVAIRALAHFLGDGVFQNCVHKEANIFVSELKALSAGGAPFNPNNLIGLCVTNIICQLLFGQCFDHADARFVRMMTNMELTFKLMGAADICKMMPWVSFFPGDPVGYKNLHRINGEIRKDFQDLINEHRSTLNTEYPRDIIDSFLIKGEEHGEEVPKTFDDHNLVNNISSIFAGGSDTTKYIILWLIAYLLNYPDVQERVCEEISSVLGKKLPTHDDMRRMPYTMATIDETLRIAELLFSSVPYNCSKDLTVQGQTIPKDAIVVFSIDSVHYDPNIYPEPEVFDPTRFLDSDGNYVRPKKLIPFTMGRHMCPGEQMGKMEIFTFTVVLLQNFELMSGTDLPPPLTLGQGVLRVPAPYTIRLIPKN